MPQVTVAEFEQFGQVDITNDTDAAILQYLASGQSLAEDWCFRPFDYNATQVDVLDGKRASQLRVSRYPIDDIDTLDEDGQALVLDTDYLAYNDSGQLVRISGGNAGRTIAWTWKRQAVTVTYAGGYGGAGPNPTPDALKWLLANIALRLYKAEAAWAAAPDGAGGGLTALSLDGVGSASYASSTANTAVAQRANQLAGGSAPSLTPAEKQGLSTYRKRNLAGARYPQGLHN